MSMRRRKPVRWLEAALHDLAAIVAVIAERNPRAAKRLAQRIFAKTDLLATFPHLGGVSAHRRDVRLMSHKNYVMYYTVHRHEVVIRAVVHGARIFRTEWLYRED
jgi:plasmid stabilization system protein ParE